MGHRHGGKTVERGALEDEIAVAPESGGDRETGPSDLADPSLWASQPKALIAGVRAGLACVAGAGDAEAVPLVAPLPSKPALGVSPAAPARGLKAAAATAPAKIPEAAAEAAAPPRAVVIDRILAESTEDATGTTLHRGSTSKVVGKGWLSCCRGRVRIPIVRPDNTALTVWQFVGLVFLTMLLFSLPFELCFGAELSKGEFRMYAIGINIYFILDVVLAFFIGYVDEKTGTVVMSPRRIARRYLSTWFVLDLLAAFPADLVVTSGGHRQTVGVGSVRFLRYARASKVGRLFRLMRANVMRKRIQLIVEANASLAFSLGLVQIVVLLCCVTHWAACAWYAVGTSSHFSTSWVTANLSADADLTERYVYAVFFALTTMTTVGYGDITAKNYDEVCFVLLLLLVASVVFASLMGTLTDLIANLNANGHVVAQKRGMLAQYLAWRGVPHNLQLRVRNYLLFVWEKNKEYVAYEDEVRSTLPCVLRQELCWHIHGGALSKTPFLAWMWGYEVALKELASLVSSKFLCGGDTLFKISMPNREAYVVLDGTVRVSLNEHISSPPEKEGDASKIAGLVFRTELASFASSDVGSPRSGASRSPKQDDSPRTPRLGPRAIIAQALSNFSLRATARRDIEKSDLSLGDLASPILSRAAERLRRWAQHEEWAACLIQKRWRIVHYLRRRSQDSVGRPQRAQHTAFKTKVLKAPTYFGESCFWQPFEEWEVGTPPLYTYSATCETRMEVLVIEREHVRAVVGMFSPWLGERLRYFQGCVQEEVGEAQRQHATQFQQQPQSAVDIGDRSQDPSGEGTESALGFLRRAVGQLHPKQLCGPGAASLGFGSGVAAKPLLSDHRNNLDATRMI